MPSRSKWRSENVTDPECLLSLAATVSTIQAELAALPQAEADEKAASTAKFIDLRDRVSKRVQDGAGPSMAPSQPRRQAPVPLTNKGMERKRAPVAPLLGPAAALAAAKKRMKEKQMATEAGEPSSALPVTAADETAGAEGRADACAAWDAASEGSA